MSLGNSYLATVVCLCSFCLLSVCLMFVCPFMSTKNLKYQKKRTKYKTQKNIYVIPNTLLSFLLSVSSLFSFSIPNLKVLIVCRADEWQMGYLSLAMMKTVRYDLRPDRFSVPGMSPNARVTLCECAHQFAILIIWIL